MVRRGPETSSDSATVGVDGDGDEGARRTQPERPGERFVLKQARAQLRTAQPWFSSVERNWREQAERLGYIVIVPAAPNGGLFFEGGAKVFPEFLIKVLSDFKILDNKFHIAGVSNGGLSAFHIAASYPQYFWSVTGLPGYLPDATPVRVRALAKVCINMYAGEMDTAWLESEKAQAAQFRAQGFIVEFSEEKGQGHVMRTLEGPGAVRLFKQFEQARHGCGK